MKTFACLLVLLSSATIGAAEPLWKDVCTQPETKVLPFCNMSLVVEARVQDLLHRIPVRSQIAMMDSDAAGYAPLHIPPYQWWTEGLHGALQKTCFTADNRTACPSSFPCPSALATSFNDTLFYLVSSAIGKEGRAISNLRTHDASIGDGLSYWTPVVNMARDPRWGRNQEVPGEDPLLTSRFAVAYVKGLQQIRYDEAKPDRPMQVAACCKHFVANSLEMWQNHSRHDFDAVVSAEDMRDYYLPPFIACVKEAGVAGIMCSYNAVNGIPSCVSEPLLKDLLRKDWGFDGYVTSDCGALTDIDTFHHYTRNPIQTAALAANATTNLNCGRVYKHFLPMALEQGFVTAATIRENLAKLVTVQMKLGLFDQPKSKGPFADLGIGEIDSLKHQSLALEAAEQSIVLLQNHASSGNQSTLPLSPGQRIAVIGPHSNASTAFLGNYHGWRCPSGNDEECMTTPFAAIAERNTGGTTVSALGCKIDGIFENIAEAVEVAKSADTIVLLVGLDNSQEEEGLDRIHTTLPGHQQQLVQAILAIGNPQTVLVLVNGGALSLGPYLRETPAIVEAAYGGQAAAEALARVLFGDSNPSGRLAATMYPPEYVDQMPLTDMGLRRGLGRTYMFYRGQAEFPFGHGLSYSNWTVDYEYSYEPGPNGGQLRLLAHVTNQGPWPGRQSLLLLAVRPNPKKQQARQKLVDYGGTAKMLEVGEQQTLFFSLDENPFEGNLGLVVLEPNGQRRSLGTWDNLTQGETSMLRKSL